MLKLLDSIIVMQSCIYIIDALFVKWSCTPLCKCITHIAQNKTQQQLLLIIKVKSDCNWIRPYALQCCFFSKRIRECIDNSLFMCQYKQKDQYLSGFIFHNPPFFLFLCFSVRLCGQFYEREHFVISFFLR